MIHIAFLLSQVTLSGEGVNLLPIFFQIDREALLVYRAAARALASDTKLRDKAMFLLFPATASDPATSEMPSNEHLLTWLAAGEEQKQGKGPSVARTSH